MPARTLAPPRDLDYTNIGKVGRRTGITLPPRKRDEHGLEEMTGLFSSPEKPVSKDVHAAIEQNVTETPVQQRAKTHTPSSATSVRRSLRKSARAVRSVSPRKSGISGTARRSGAVDVLGQPQPELPAEDQTEAGQSEEDERTERAEMTDQEDVPEAVATAAVPETGRSPVAQPATTPVKITQAKSFTARPATVRRFSPERTPLRNHVMKSKSAYVPRVEEVRSAVEVTRSEADEPVPEETPTRANTTVQMESTAVTPQDVIQIDDFEEETNNASLDKPADDETANVEGDGLMEDAVGLAELSEEEEQSDLEPPPLPPMVDDEDEDQTFDLSMLREKKKGQNKANSRRKRKSDYLEEDRRIESSPAAKRAKRQDDRTAILKSKEPASRSSKAKTSRPVLAKKDKNIQLSRRRQEELDNVVQKIRARPGPKKSLFVLRRETPIDDTVSRTRSGRVTIKPVAWWRNEGIEYDAGDGTGAGIGDGWRFPMRSIKQVIRQEEKIPTPKPAKKKGVKKSRKRAAQQESDSDMSDIEHEDPDADDWELDSGTLTAPMGVWDPELQACADEEEDVNIAHAAEAIQTVDVKGQGFKYAKLISQPFFGVGIVDVPVGGIKRAKNSRKMHMSFFVFSGRVSVRMGPIQGPETTFSIGKGGFWHVPRGEFPSFMFDH